MTQPVLSDGSRTVPVPGVNTDRPSNKGQVSKTSIVTQNSDEALLSSFTKQRSIVLDGRCTGFRLSNFNRLDGSSYSTDPIVALAEWVQDVMALVDSEQGDSTTLDSTVRGETSTGICTDFRWEKSGNAPYVVRYNLEFTEGDVIVPLTQQSAGTASPSNTATLGGYDLQYLDRYSEIKRLDTRTTAIAFASSPEDNIALPRSGVIREITLTGRITGDRTDRQTFDSNIESLIGDNQTATYSSAFPGHDLTVAVDRFEPTRREGTTRVNEYSLQLTEGSTLSGP